MLNIEIIKTTSPKAKPQDESKLGFGAIFSDHMFICKYQTGKGWYDAKIQPYQNISLDPAAAVFHYGQEIFEGLKAYRTVDGGISLFRAKDNFRRMNASAERLGMPPLDIDDIFEALKQLIALDKDWVPRQHGTSVYIRPTMIAVDSKLGVRASDNYIFYIICSPSGAYYPTGFAPVSIYVEDRYSRASKGGTGFTKCGGNYAASIMPANSAHQKGYSQVLWLDSSEHRYVEEVGSMNMFFFKDGALLTAPLDGSVLPGITRDSVIKLAAEMGYKTIERPIPIDEIISAIDGGTLDEAFGTGTAAVVSPVGAISYMGKDRTIGGGKTGALTQKLYDELVGIQYGSVKDTHGWVSQVV